MYMECQKLEKNRKLNCDAAKSFSKSKKVMPNDNFLKKNANL